MPDPKKGLESLLDQEALELQPRALGEETPEVVLDDEQDDIDEAALRTRLSDLGFELRRKRAKRGVYAKNDGVEGKTKLTVHLTDALRRDVKMASVILEISESEIGEEAFRAWLDEHSLSRPGT